ncbi:DUF427 domain-containing protein [Pseudonocardia humida]|uniref:DUF427 domain-containing protein n=1 Tax=Pseudonocardia humida TaxID=2800819 RepID=A0ABT0ZWK5_9PSEU|nr:DUF427 domain-containing protein [Pseudonocardia humida]MCO1655111.1 DUF427 domain-containing protein [Pseudonocardia humida]
MSTRARDLLTAGYGELRHEPLGRRLRARWNGTTVVDTTRGVLLWEPRRILPVYAVPAADVRADLRPGGPALPVPDDVGVRMPALSELRLLPGVPFAVHTAEGRPLDVELDGTVLHQAAYQLDDPQLAGYVAVEFGAFDWLEEDEPVAVHPKDPFHRIEVLAGSRPVRVELDGHVLAESAHPTLLFETLLPVRYYLPVADVRVELVPSATRTGCPYKGEAVYFSPVVDGRERADLAWSYPDPLPESSRVRDLVCFYTERLDVVLDGERQDRPVTPWS